MKPRAAAVTILALLALAACGDRATATSAPAVMSEAVPVPSAWTATAIAGKPLIAGSTVTLAFTADGRVSGTASCNRYAGPVTLDGGKIAFGALASTRMACVGGGLNEQESAYFAALAAATGAAITGGTLVLSGPNGPVVTFSKAAP